MGIATLRGPINKTGPACACLAALVAPTAGHLATGLDERSRRWPSTVNPYVFISNYTVARYWPVGGADRYVHTADQPGTFGHAPSSR